MLLALRWEMHIYIRRKFWKGNWAEGKGKSSYEEQVAQSPVVRCRMNSMKSLSCFIKGITISLLLVLSQSFCFSVCVLTVHGTHRSVTLWWRYFRRTYRQYGERFGLNPRTFPQKYCVIQNGAQSSSLVGWLVTSMFGKSVGQLVCSCDYVSEV
jgi:hypothetical protein